MKRALHFRPWLIGALILSVAVGCTSRYRLDLYLIADEARTKVKVEKTEFAIDAVLGDPFAQIRKVPGDGNVVTLITGSRGETLSTEAQDLVSWDRYVRFQIFMELPSEIEPGPISLKDKSFVRQLGRYEQAAEDKMFFADDDGTLIVDSLADKKLYGTLESRFVNQQGKAITFSGQFKVKIAD
jgi:hypothetical protein